MEDGFLYRYISFESFVGMVQSQSLTLVQPELWEDPKESEPFFVMLNAMDADDPAKLVLFSIYNKTYAQCWTRLSESDAMWRIYSYNNRAIQIKVSVNNLKLLPDVNVIPVKYTDNIEVKTDGKVESLVEALAIKRVAFEHEKEVRIIKHYKFADFDDAKQHCYSIASIFASNGYEALRALYPDLAVEEGLEKCADFLNLGDQKQNTIEVSFRSIPDFIEGVKVHPQAPDWYVNIVNEYCSRNGIPFEGKSTLYSNK